MSDNTNWKDSQKGDSPQSDIKGPTGSHHRSDPHQGNSSDEFIETQPNRNQDLQNDLENDYPGGTTSSQQASGRNQNTDASDDNPVMGSENRFDSFSDTDPNRYNNNAGLGTAGSGGEHEGNYSDETKEPENGYDSSEDADNKNTPKHPEF
jgi:hypothetical protein